MTTAVSTPHRGGNGIIWAVLLTVTLALGALLFHAQDTRNSLRLDAAGNATIVASKSAAYRQALDGFYGVVDGALTGTARNDIAAVVEAQVDAAFAPVHARLPAYLDFHYSVLGEYTEIGSALSGNFSRAMQERLFDEAALTAALSRADTAISAEFDQAVGRAIETINGAARQQLALSEADLALLGETGVVALSREDALARFDAPLLTARGAGAVVGGALVARGVYGLSRVLVRRIGTKAALRVGGKFTGLGGGVSSGAAIGSVLGPIGTVLGSVAGGVAGWLATDAVLIRLDEVINRDEFAAELTAMIEAQKAEIKADILSRYSTLLTGMAAQQKAGFAAPVEVVFRGPVSRAPERITH